MLFEIIEYLNQQDEKACLTGLLGLKSLCKKYEYELDDTRGPLYEIIGQTFGILGNLINLVINLNNDFSFEALYLICKIFFIFFYMTSQTTCNRPHPSRI